MPPRTIDLDTGWQIRQDLWERGRKDRWWQTPPTDQWLDVTLPAPSQKHLGIQAPPVVWYRRRLDLADLNLEPGERVWLRFDAAATDTRAWVNGTEVGQNTGDWVPFQFDITDALGAGERDHADLLIRCDRVQIAPQTWIEGAPVQGGHLTKGFHDILSVHKGGLWDAVRLEVTRDLALLPDGVGVTAHAFSGRVDVDVELERNAGGGSVRIELVEGAGERWASAGAVLADGALETHLSLDVPNPRLWSPESPHLYTLQVELHGAHGISQRQQIRFGFRSVAIGDNDEYERSPRAFLNGRPIFFSGVLDWGHEPHHVSPAPSPQEVRNRFAQLKDLGFNMVCICMWYPPRYFYDIADETGMMLWQEHPVWKPPMGDEHIPEYQRQFTRFFRRDRNHPSVVLVSGSCEHERFNPKLAAWWWGRARSLMPDRLAQIQTAFFAWTDLEKTDLYDEHTYDSSGRWVRYLEDIQHDLAKLKPKPFIMGESILYTNWPDAAEFAARQPKNQPRPWYFPVGLDATARFEHDVRERFGEPALARFKAHARRFHLQGRKFQLELYRQYPNHAGLVMNHLRDVMACRCGFLDEFDRWYFSPEELRPWLGEAPILLRTPDHLRGFVGAGDTDAELGVANFGREPVNAPATLETRGGGLAQQSLTPALKVDQGEVGWVPVRINIPEVRRPTRIDVRAAVPGLDANAWTLWSLPEPAPAPRGLVRLAGLPFTPADQELEFEEKAYSSGWGSPIHSWKPLLPDPAELLPDAAPWRHADPLPTATKAVLAHKLTPAVCDYLESGGSVVLLASKAAGSVPTKFINTWGQLPLILEHGPLAPGDADWVLDLLDHDLSKRSVRSVFTGEMGLDGADGVEPVIRLVYCHDMVDRPKLYDSLFTARVGTGLLTASCLDHSTPAGRYLLDRLVAFATSSNADTRGRLDPALVRSWSVRP